MDTQTLPTEDIDWTLLLAHAARVHNLSPVPLEQLTLMDFPSPLASSTPVNSPPRNMLRELLNIPDFNYLQDIEPVTPPLSPVHFNPDVMLLDLDPLLSANWSPRHCPSPSPKELAESITSGPETDYGFPQPFQSQLDWSNITHPQASLNQSSSQDVDVTNGSVDNVLPLLSAEEVANSLCNLSSEHADDQSLDF